MRASLLPIAIVAFGAAPISYRLAPTCPFVITGTTTFQGKPAEGVQVWVDSTQPQRRTESSVLGASTNAQGHYRLIIPCPHAAGTVLLRFRRVGFKQIARSMAIEDAKSPFVVNADFTAKDLNMVGIMVTALTDDELPGRSPRFDAWHPASDAAELRGPFDRRSSSIVRHFLWDNELPPANAFSVEGLVESVQSVGQRLRATPTLPWRWMRSRRPGHLITS